MEQRKCLSHQTDPRLMRCLLFLFPAFLQAQSIQLAPPRFLSGDVFFIGKTQVAMAFDLDSAVIHYALDGTPSGHSPVYTTPVQIRESTNLRAVSTHPSFLMSAVAEKQFLKVKYQPVSINLLTEPNKSYPGRGAASLFDLKKGSSDLHDGNWLGFLADTVVVETNFRQNIQCKTLLISTLYDINAWVLPFREITVLGKNKLGIWQKIGYWQLPDDKATLASPALYTDFQYITLQKFKTRQIKIEMVPFGPLPVGHAGAGKPAWLFLDEIGFQ